MRLSLPPFNPEAQHIATRPLTLAGKHLKPGQVIPPAVDLRRVRQLYETRRISVAPEKPHKSQIGLPVHEFEAKMGPSQPRRDKK